MKLRASARLALAAVAVVGGAACDPVYDEPCAVGPVLSFDPGAAPARVPFPSDAYTRPDATSPTGRRLDLGAGLPAPFGPVAEAPALAGLVAEMNRLSGFSLLAHAYLPVGREPDAGTRPGPVPTRDDGVVLLVVDPTSPDDGELVPVDTEWRAPDLHLIPRRPLRERTRHALVATRRLAPAAGCYRASDGMRAAWRDWAAGEASPAAALLDDLAARGIEPGEVLSLTSFTTGAVTDGLARAAQVLDERAALAPPSFRDWRIVPHPDPRLWATAHASFDVPVFLPEASGGWRLDGSGAPIVDHVETLSAYFTIPAADAHPDGPPYPIATFQHGMFNDKHELRAPLVTEAAERGFAMVATDAVCHGERLPPGSGDVAQLLCLHDVADPARWRDNFRESVANLVWLRHALDSLASVDLDGDGRPEMDPTRVYDVGASFGSILSGSLLAVEPRFEAHALVASGAKLPEILASGELAAVIELLVGVRPDTELLLFGVLQAVLEPADSAAYVRRATSDPFPGFGGALPPVLQQGSAFDDTVGGPSGAWLARAGGWPQVEPVVWEAGVGSVPAPHAGSGYYQLDTSEHTLIFDDHPLGRAAREQLLHFLASVRNGDPAEIIDPLADPP